MGKGGGKGSELTVYRIGGEWINKRNYADHASSKRRAQNQAIDAANGMPKNQGGGEPTTKGHDGKIGSKGTISPGNDPNQPREREQ